MDKQVLCSSFECKPCFHFLRGMVANTCCLLFHFHTGDTSSTVSALCYTVAKSAQGSSLHALESGSDYKSRGMSNDNRVIFGPGVSMSTCDVKLIDDSEYELSEEFELVLSDASDNARMGDVNLAKVVIDGPNDASTVTLGNATFTFSEDAGMTRSLTSTSHRLLV